jgi:hypothetical protein
LWPNPLKYFNNVLCFFVFFPSEVLLFILLLAFSVFFIYKGDLQIEVYFYSHSVSLFQEADEEDSDGRWRWR